MYRGRFYKMNFQIEQHKKVLVTGGTGFIAGWIIKQLVEAGVCVHATVRDPDNEEKVAHLKKLSIKGPGEVILFKADLLKPESLILLLAVVVLFFIRLRHFYLNSMILRKIF